MRRVSRRVMSRNVAVIVQGTGRDGAYISRVYIATDGLIKRVSNFDIMVRSMFVLDSEPC